MHTEHKSNAGRYFTLPVFFLILSIIRLSQQFHQRKIVQRAIVSARKADMKTTLRNIKRSANDPQTNGKLKAKLDALKVWPIVEGERRKRDQRKVWGE